MILFEDDNEFIEKTIINISLTEKIIIYYCEMCLESINIDSIDKEEIEKYSIVCDYCKVFQCQHTYCFCTLCKNKLCADCKSSHSTFCKGFII